VLNESFVYVGIVIPFLGDGFYIRDTIKGLTQPNRVSWLMWGIATSLVGFAQIRQGVVLPCLLSFAIGLGDLLVFGVSFIRGNGVWKLGPFDLACGIASALGLIVWAASSNNTAALIAFVVADAFATIPTLMKSWLAPQSETTAVYLASVVSSAMVLATVLVWTSAAVAFALWLAAINFLLVILISSRIGPRVRASLSRAP